MSLNSSALNTATQEEGVDFVINTYFSCSTVFGPSPASQPCFLFLFFFFKHGPFFKVFIEFVTILLLFYGLVFWPEGTWELRLPNQGSY